MWLVSEMWMWIVSVMWMWIVGEMWMWDMDVDVGYGCGYGDSEWDVGVVSSEYGCHGECGYR